MNADASRVRTLIVDDEPLARRRLRTMLADEPDVEIVGEASNGTAAVHAIGEKRPDLLLLDIQMPGKDGFEVLREIAGIHHPVVVFVTAHDEHAIRAFEVQALDYVLKPVVEDRLQAAVRRAISRLREQRRGDVADAMARLLERVDHARRGGRVAVKGERGVTLIPAADIQWVEADGDLVTLHTARGRHVLRTTMADFESRLTTPPFTRVHRSAIVNVDCIQEIQPLFKGDYVIVMKSGAQIRTGRTHRANVQALMRGERRS
jgi:two-component system, LytTR family, response regulator